MCILSALSHVKPIVNAGKGDAVGERFGDRNRCRDCRERWKDESRHGAEQALQSVNIEQREWNHRTGHQATLKKVRSLARRVDTAAEIKLKPKVTSFPLEKANEALMAVKNDAIDGAAVIMP